MWCAESGTSHEPQPTAKELETWRHQLLKYHKAAGHPNSYNLARIVKAGRPAWQVRAALELTCDDCQAPKACWLVQWQDSSSFCQASAKSLPGCWHGHLRVVTSEPPSQVQGALDDACGNEIQDCPCPFEVWRL